MAIASSWAFWGPLLAVTAVLLLVFGNFRARAAVVCMALCAGFTDGLASRLVKEAVGRPRPHMVEEVRTVGLARTTPPQLGAFQPAVIGTSDPRILPLGGRSFISSHAANNFVMATIAFLFYRRWGWLVFIPATLVAYSRVYNGAHWPSDVIVGAVYGATVALFFMAFMSWLWNRAGPRWFPRFHGLHPRLIPA